MTQVQTRSRRRRAALALGACSVARRRRIRLQRSIRSFAVSASRSATARMSVARAAAVEPAAPLYLLRRHPRGRGLDAQRPAARRHQLRHRAERAAYLIRQRKSDDQQVPKFRSDMTAPEIAAMLESLFRVRGGTVEFKTLSLQPRPFLGANGFQFDYEHLDSDELWRKGRAVGAVVNGAPLPDPLRRRAIALLSRTLCPISRRSSPRRGIRSWRTL